MTQQKTSHFKLNRLAGAALIAGGACLLTNVAHAAPSWKGKTFKVVIRATPGGGYDFYGRLIVRHMPKYLPGKPRTIAQNMSGAGGIVAANYMMRRAPRDGTVISILNRAIATAQRLGEKGVQYDVAKLTSIGSMTGSVYVWVVHATHPVKSLSQLRKWKGTPLKFSSTGRGSSAYQRVKMLAFDGYPIKTITGYDGNDEKTLAVVRKEVAGTAGSYESLRGYIKEHKFSVIGRMGSHPDIASVEQASDLASPDGKALIAFSAAPLLAGRPFFGPPGLKPDVVKALRSAFAKAMKDPDMIAETKRAKRSLNYVSGEEMHRIYTDMLSASPKIVAAFKAMKQGGKKAGKTYKGKITGLEDRNKKLTMARSNGKVFSTNISGSRTAVTVNGKKTKRKALKVGMTCTIKAPGNNKEAKSVDCK